MVGSFPFVTLATQRLNQLVDFYQQLFQQEPTVYREAVYAEFSFPGLRLGIFCPDETQAGEFATDRAGRMSLCLEVGDLDRAIAQFSELGYPPPGPILSPSHGREVYAYDPDGNRLILHQSRSQESLG